MGKVERIFAVTLAFFAAACGGSERKSREPSVGASFVAYAFSDETRTGAFAFSQMSIRAARDEAVAECANASGGGKCKVIGAFAAECGALAAAAGERLTAAPGADGASACAAAQTACDKRGKDSCTASTFACRVGEPGLCKEPPEKEFAEEANADPDESSEPHAESDETPADPPLQMEFNTYSDTEGSYGAISIVSANGKVIGFVGYDEPDETTARELALEGCRNKAGALGAGCKVEVVFHNGCAAFASTNDGGYGTGWGDTPAIACRWALDTCDNYNKTGCSADGYLCSPGGRNGTCDGALEFEGGKTTIHGD